MLLVCNCIIMSCAQIKTCDFIDYTKAFLKCMKRNHTDSALAFVSDVIKEMNVIPPVALFLNNKLGQQENSDCVCSHQKMGFS